MTAKTKAASPILDAVHETARDLHDAGFIDKYRMREYDALCLAPPAYSSRRIRALRARHKHPSGDRLKKFDGRQNR